MTLEVKYEYNDHIYKVDLMTLFKLLGIRRTPEQIQAAINKEISRQ